MTLLQQLSLPSLTCPSASPARDLTQACTSTCASGSLTRDLTPACTSTCASASIACDVIEASSSPRDFSDTGSGNDYLGLDSDVEISFQSRAESTQVCSPFEPKLMTRVFPFSVYMCCRRCIGWYLIVVLTGQVTDAKEKESRREANTKENS